MGPCSANLRLYLTSLRGTLQYCNNYDLMLPNIFAKVQHLFASRSPFAKGVEGQWYCPFESWPTLVLILEGLSTGSTLLPSFPRYFFFFSIRAIERYTCQVLWTAVLLYLFLVPNTCSDASVWRETCPWGWIRDRSLQIFKLPIQKWSSRLQPLMCLQHFYLLLLQISKIYLGSKYCLDCERQETNRFC